jgi:GNAT superfamily N-acetyltransferase
MITRPRRRKARGRKAARKRAAGKVAAKTSASKAAAKQKPAKARATRPARGRKAATASAKRPAKAARKSGPLRRHVLTSARRPKAQPLRRLQVKRQAAGSGLNKASKRAPALIRDFTAADAAAVNAVALAAFEQFRGEYHDWPEFSKSVGAMADLADGGELIVAESDGRIAGAVAYFGPQAAKPADFDAAWSIIRMVVVDPAARGAGLGRLLTEECIARARRHGAGVIALHTSPIMRVALAMYLRLGFVPLRDAAPIFGVPYRIYLKRL